MEINDFISKHHFFTKDITSSGGQKVIAIPSYEQDNFKEGEKVLVIKLEKKGHKEVQK